MSFAESFWGDNGFEVMMQNFRDGSLASKEFGDWIAHLCSQNKLISTAFKELATTKTQFSVGSFSPLYTMVKAYADRMSIHYAEIVRQLQDLQCRIQKYHEQQRNRQKQTKATEALTENLTKTMRELSVSVQEYKKKYHLRQLDFEKARRAQPLPQQKDLDKLEALAKKAAEDYRQIIGRFNTIREDFEQKMAGSCKRLQEAEEAHLIQMISFVSEYFDTAEKSRNLAANEEKESRAAIGALTKEKLIEMFVVMKATSSEKPSECKFEEPNISQLGPIPVPSPIVTPDNIKPFQPFGKNSLFAVFKLKPEPAGDHLSSNGGISQDAASSTGSVTEPAKADVAFDLLGDFPSPVADSERPVDEWDALERRHKENQDKDDDDSFGDDDDSDSDSEKDIRHKLGTIKIKPKNEVVENQSNPSDISQIMLQLTLKRNRYPMTSKPKRNSVPTIDTAATNTFDFADFSPTINWGNSPEPPTLAKSDLVSPTLPEIFGDAFSVPPATNQQTLFPLPKVPPARSVSAQDIFPIPQVPPRIPERSSHPPRPPPRIPARAPPPDPPSTSPEVNTPRALATPPLPTILEMSTSLPSESILGVRQTQAALALNNTSSQNAVDESNKDRISETTFEDLPVINNRVSSATPTSPPQKLSKRRSSADDGRRKFMLSPTSIDSDAVPITFLFYESIEAVSAGLESSKCTGLKISGRLSMSLPMSSAVVRTLTTPSPETAFSQLKLRIAAVSGVELHHHKRLVSQMKLENSCGYEFNMAVLAEELKKQMKQDDPDNIAELDLIKYKLKGESCHHACPLAASYKMSQAFGSEAPAGSAVALQLLLRHRGTSICPAFIRNPTVEMTVANFGSIVAKPPVSSVDDKLDAPNTRCSWQLPDIAPSMPDYVINADLRYKSKGPTATLLPPPLISLAFHGEGHSFSNLKLDLVSLAHFRIAQIQKTFKSGRFEIVPEA